MRDFPASFIHCFPLFPLFSSGFASLAPFETRICRELGIDRALRSTASPPRVLAVDAVHRMGLPGLTRLFYGVMSCQGVVRMSLGHADGRARQLAACSRAC